MSSSAGLNGGSCDAVPGSTFEGLRSVTTYSAPYDYWHDRYQAYYREGIRLATLASGGTFEQRTLARFPRLLRTLRRLRHSWKLRRVMNARAVPVGAMLDRTAARIGGKTLPASGLFHPLVGQYLVETRDGVKCKVCIDAQDAGKVASPELLQWCDLYFKTNYWANAQYDPKVVPLYNGNPLLLGKLDYLKELRRKETVYDICFVVRIWKGMEGHLLRIAEAVAKLKCRKFLLAYLVADDVPAYAERLGKIGVPWQLGPMPLRRLWEVSAQSRINLIRLGKHSCVPWRMADLLAMGACPVLDQAPFTIWPCPLKEGEHYLSLGAATATDQSVASEDQYALMSERLERFVADHHSATHVRETNSRYFDDHFAPDAMGRHICAVATERATKARFAII